MSPRPPCQTADFFVLRSPGLPLEALFSLEQAQSGPAPAAPRKGEGEGLRQRLRELALRQGVREAIALASPDLDARLGAWLDGALEPSAARSVERGLLKYLGRMCGRATPFGLFAAVSRGTWAPASCLTLAAWQGCGKVLRLDWGVLETLVARLEQDSEIRAQTVFQTNTSLFLRGGWYRYLERREQAGGGNLTYHLEAVEATPHLDFVLEQVREGLSLEALTAALADHLAVAPGEARAFLEQVIDAQVLCGQRQPALTSPDPLCQVITTLQAHPRTLTMAEPLVALGAELRNLQEAPLGALAPGLGRVAAALAGLGVPPGTRDLLQVDLFRPGPDLALSPGVRRTLEEGADLLRRLTPAPQEGPLDQFLAAFLERYGTRWVPLLEVLDEESGLGFDGGTLLDSPLLEGLPIPSPAAPRPFTPRDRYLLAQLPRWQDTLAWELADADVAALAQPEPPAFPASFAALACLAAPSVAALDRGEFQFWMEQYSGPTAARWLGRFASGDPALNDLLQRHLRKEEAARPDAVFAEVVHVPEGRMGNVLARPSLRDCEIPFLATSGVARERTILPADLLVTVRGERVRLASTRLDREVVPRLSSAHNFKRGPAVYRFLAHLQDQDGRPGGWSWGALNEQPFLPRVTRGRHVLSLARWRITAQELKAPTDDFQILRQRRGLPRFVRLTDADNALLMDLDEPLWVETLLHLVAKRPAFTLTECFPEPGQALVTAPEGPFAHELVIPFEASPDSPRPVPAPSQVQEPEARIYPPGSEWLYLKLYGGRAGADRLLIGLEPLLQATGAEGLWDRWHFVRYQDPDHHLRLRFHGVPARLLAELLPRLHGHLEEQLGLGLLWKWQLDTFEPEWERYGGPLGFALAEPWFCEDSRFVLAQLAAGLTQDERWRAGLRRVDAIWAGLGLTVAIRKGLAESARDAFRKEFRDAGAGAVAMGAKFRALRKGLAAEVPLASGNGLPEGLASLAMLREASDRGVLQTDLQGLAGSLSHMHLNRLLRSDHRASEWVLMAFLARLYDAHLAMTKPPAAKS